MHCSLLPLLEENAESRQVYLPEGEWIGFFDRKPYQGKQMICTNCDGKIPVFIRSGYEKQFRKDVPELIQLQHLLKL